MEASGRDIVVKVNTFLIPDINDRHLMSIARAVKKAGAVVMDIRPVFPHAEFALIPVPDSSVLSRAKRDISQVIRQSPGSGGCRPCHSGEVMA